MYEELQKKINLAFDNLINARKRLFEDTEEMIIAKEQLKNTETAILIMGNLKGTNKEARDADMISRTSDERGTLLEAEKAERVATLALEYALDARRNLESMMRLEELEVA
jgi:hypothetical protein